MDVLEVLRRGWGLADVAPVRLDGGMNSATWRVEHRGAAYVAKHVRPADAAWLLRGCEVARRLAGAGLRTGAPVPTLAGPLVADDGEGGAVALLEHVPGRPLTGRSAAEQGTVADVLAAVHRTGPLESAAGVEEFLDGLVGGLLPQPGAPLPAVATWVPGSVAEVRARVAGVPCTWSTLHTDPAPEAFLHDDATGVTGLVDWAGATRGPVLYDVASAVMYLGGPASAAAFLDAYRASGVLPDAEWALLDDLRRLRWAVQAAYFAHRLGGDDRTGLADAHGNVEGLADAVRGLADLGVTAPP